MNDISQSPVASGSEPIASPSLRMGSDSSGSLIVDRRDAYSRKLKSRLQTDIQCANFVQRCMLGRAMQRALMAGRPA